MLDANLGQGTQCERMYIASRSSACALGLPFLAQPGVDDGLSHLAARRVAGAKKQDSFPLWYAHLLLFVVWASRWEIGDCRANEQLGLGHQYAPIPAFSQPLVLFGADRYGGSFRFYMSRSELGALQVAFSKVLLPSP